MLVEDRQVELVGMDDWMIQVSEAQARLAGANGEQGKGGPR